LDVLGSPPGTIVSHVAGQDSRISGLLGGWEHLFRIFEPSAPSDAPAKPGDSTSMMVKGYGNALYRLGRRYEFGRGAMANPREALRCYSKSARLGNFWAMARLASDIFVRKSGTAPTNDGSPIVSDGATGADVPRAASGDPPSDAPAAH
jgi:TPR repeat protein